MLSSSLQKWLLSADPEVLVPENSILHELKQLAEASNGNEYWPGIENQLLDEREDLRKTGRVHCRLLVLGMLAEWFQMHDLHEPFAMGPPSKNQPCCKVENEMTSRETCECGKLFPRCLIKPGCGKISEDPRRRELYRVWLSRNCHFINNYIPLLVVATASNMDFQPTTTKFGVIEYMTKYMTKTHHGSLITIMMDSFAKCMEQATEQGKGLKSATAKYFNLQATQDVNCQGETMHLNFRLPRYLCSRSFIRLSTKKKTWQQKC